MLLLLIASGVMASGATPPYPFYIGDLGALSPLIQYAPRPFVVDPGNITSTETNSSNETWMDRASAQVEEGGNRRREKFVPLNDAQLQPYVQAGWTAVDYKPEQKFGDNRKDWVRTQAAGDSFTISIPSGISVEVEGETEVAKIDVELDGLRLGDRDMWLFLNSSGSVLSLNRVPGGTGPHNLTLTLRSGGMGITRIRLGNHGYSSWVYAKAVWGSSGSNVTYSGTWAGTTSAGVVAAFDYPETSEAGAKMSIAVQPNSAWVELLGYSSGSYAVRCVPSPPNTTDTTYYGHQGYLGRRVVRLYAAQLDAAQNYTLELTNLANTMGVTDLVTAQYRPPPKHNVLRYALGIGLGVGLPTILMSVALAYKFRKVRRERAQAAPEVGIAQPYAPSPVEDKEDEDEDDDDAQPSPDCVVCLDAPPEFAVAECGHLCMCASCCDRIVAGQKQCPVCSKPITEPPVRIFRP